MTRLVLHEVPPPVEGTQPKLLRAGLYLAGVGATAGLFVFLTLYYIFSNGLPEIPRVERYWPPIITEVHTDDAVLAGEFYNERRKVIANTSG